MARIDAIALDLDGTLLDRADGVSPANQRAIFDALGAGIRIVLVTGRGTETPARLVRELRLNVPAICAHGALTKDFLADRTIGHIPVPLKYARPLVEYAEMHRLSAAVYFDEHFHRLAGSPFPLEDVNAGHWREVASLVAALGVAPTFIRFLGHAAVEAVRATFSDLPLHFKYETWGEFEECAVTSAEATKERALMRLCNDLAIPAERVMAIGDSRNDVPMLQWAGIGVAMGNAALEVREAVDHVTGRCEDDGVAGAIERYALGGARKSA